MTKEDLIKLPLGSYNLTDGIYDYVLHKSILNLDDKSRVGYLIYDRQTSLSGGRIVLHEDVDLDGNITMSVSATIGGLSVHNDSSFEIINELILK